MCQPENLESGLIVANFKGNRELDFLGFSFTRSRDVFKGAGFFVVARRLTRFDSIPLDFKAFMRSIIVRIEPQVDYVMGCCDRSIVGELVTTKSSNHWTTRILAIVNLSKIVKFEILKKVTKASNHLQEIIVTIDTQLKFKHLES